MGFVTASKCCLAQFPSRVEVNGVSLEGSRERLSRRILEQRIAKLTAQAEP
jgi:hypothetical protein